MSDHTEASQEARILCDLLLEELGSRIPNLKRKQSKRWCGIFQSGRKRFAYVNHRRIMSRLEIWCLGKPSDLQHKSHLRIIPRKDTNSGFGIFQSRFFIENESQVSEAAKLLADVSYGCT